MVILIMNTVNRIYPYIKIFCLQNHNVLYITEKAIHKLGSQLHTPSCFATFFLPKQNEIFCLVSLLLTGEFFGCTGFNVCSRQLSGRGCCESLKRLKCLGLVVTGEANTGQLLEQCLHETMRVCGQQRLILLS